MAERSKRIELFEKNKMDCINKETMKLYNKYKIDMEMRELSNATVYGYETDLFAWFIYVYENQGNQCITELDEDDLGEFLYYCKKQGNNTRRLKRRMSSISALYKYLKKKRIITENPMEFISRPSKDVDVVQQNFLTQDQVKLMREKLKEHGDIQLETYALLSLSTMARVTAISNTKWSQIDFDQRTINDVLEKEGKIVTLYFSDEVKELLLKLKEYRNDNNINCEHVLITNYGGISQVSVGTLSEWAKKIGEMIGVPSLHCHDFRHTGSQLLKLAGMPIETISELLNHSGLDVTKKFYLRQDKQKIQTEKDRYKI